MQQLVNLAPSPIQFPVADTIEKAHRRLAKFNQRRLQPQLPTRDWRKGMAISSKMLLLERELIDYERFQIAKAAEQAPTKPDAFLEWFRELRKTGPGQHDPLFNWLANEASHEELTWFVKQEVAGEAGFEDLTALTQLKFPAKPKLEMAQNYWDEMGRGKESAMHGPMLGDVARELGIGPYKIDDIEIEPLMLANTLLGLASHREYAYHSVGALGVIELTAPDRSEKVYLGLKRLGLSPAGQRYFLLHSTIDIKHSADWEKNVLYPIVAERPQAARAIAEGALMRLRAGERCFDKYKNRLWKKH